MGLDDVVAALRDCAVFGRVDDRRLRLVALTGETLRFLPGETLFAQGEDGEAAFVVVEGEAEVLAPTEHGARLLAVLGRGELFGEIAALCDRPRTATVRARGELTALKLPSAALKRLLAEFDDVALALIGMMATRLDAANRRLAAGEAG
jgi:CRP-like cAMP-binding protein